MLKKLLLIIIGIILSLIILELGLRFVGWSILSYQEYKNNKVLKNKAQYRIMCLGESTTAGQYPVQLQQILNKKYPGRFSVVDCGIPGTNLESISLLLENNINKYSPNIAICMLGINNKWTVFNETSNNIKYIKKNKKLNLKIYKLFMLIKQHLKNFTVEKELIAETIKKQDIESLCDLAQQYYWSKEYKKAEKVSKQILQIDSKNEIALYILATIYYYFLSNSTEAYEICLNAINNDVSFHKPKFYIIAIEYCIKNNIEIDGLIEKLMNDSFDIEFMDNLLELYRLIKNHLSKEQLNIFKEKLLIQNDELSIAFKAIDFFEQKNYKKAEEYFKKAEEIRVNFPNIETYNLYKLIIKKLIEKNIKVICMQYPIRSIKPLQEQLKDEPYYNKISFVSNEKLFKDALMKKNYDEIFKDQFAGDFGHCTNFGNTMIAVNIVKTLEKILNLKQNQ